MDDNDTAFRFSNGQPQPDNGTLIGKSVLGYDSASDDDDDEDECRVCRGSYEDGRPLFSPCRCSGSIGLVHQDCLKQWLASKATRGQKCELCGTTFQFAPKYMEGAPERLRFHEVVTGVVHRGFDQWLPFLLHSVLCAVLWLFALPLATAYSYYGWLHHPSSVMSRWKYELIVGDTVSGVVITSIIIVSFLSFMSFADFLRQHWEQLNEQQRLEAQNVDVAENARRNMFRIIEQDQLRHANAFRPQPRQQFIVEDDEMDDIVEDDFREAMEEHPAEREQFEPDEDNFEEEFLGLNGDVDEHEQRHLIEDEWDDEDLFPAVENVIQRRAGFPANQHNNIGQLGAPLREARNPVVAENRFEPQFEAVQPIVPPGEDLDPFQDVQLDLDEILGLRGTIYALVRNILFLLSFNATYLGIFVFIPHTIGYNVVKVCSRSSAIKGLFVLIFPFKSEVLYIASSLNAESRRLNVVILLPDVVIIVLGYLALVLMAFMWNIVCSAYMRRVKTMGVPEQQQPIPPLWIPPLPHDEAFFDEDDDAEPFQHHRTIADLINATFQCAAAVGKVGVLLFLKMLLLPLLLGVGLDVATLTLVGESASSRVTYAGGDLFGAISTHWVVGISFMLLVTVSVLQLREVVHPDLFARMIRPQEPQPDLLKNLLQESGVTHAKRMFSSLGIYLTLLLVHVWMPAKLLGYLGVNRWMPLFRLRIWHIFLPQLLIPLELLVFHLFMLAFLEKYKNCIGEMQHRWLVRMSSWLELTGHLLPKTIAKFVYVGSRPIVMRSVKVANGDLNAYLPGAKGIRTVILHDTTVEKAEQHKEANGAIDAFWKELGQMRHPSDDFVRSNIVSTANPGDAPTSELGVTKRNGQRHLKSSERYICLPDNEKTKLSTSIGPYRLRRRACGRSDKNVPTPEFTVIEFWREEPGQPIPRPPEEWDDLREGGAKAGRWAWGEEPRSPIEEGIAHRSSFMHGDKKLILWAKVFFLLVISWAATLVTLCTLMNLPIILGRTFFSILALPKLYHHDPINFAIGVFIILPILINIESLLCIFKDMHPFECTMIWAGRYRRPASTAKIRVIFTSLLIWFVLAPLALGLTYRLNIAKNSAWWEGRNIDTAWDLLLAWIVGTLLINLWGVICYFDLFRRNILFELGLDLNGGNENQNVQRRNEEEADGVGGLRRWQGSEGRIGSFVRNLYDVLSNWEWEKLDHAILLDECALPIFRHLLISLFSPTVSEILFVLCHGGMGYADERRVPLLGAMENGAYRLVTFRIFSCLTIFAQLVMIFKAPLKKWFEKAQQAARDDRYLIGEILLNLKERE